MNVFRINYIMYVDVKAQDEEEAYKKFEELDLTPKGDYCADGFIDVSEIYPVDKNGARERS